MRRASTLDAKFVASFHGRGLEWFSSLVMLGWALVLAHPAQTLEGPAYQAFRRLGTTEEAWCVVFAIIATARIAALVINGRWPRGPYVRMFGSFFGVVTWAQIGWLFIDGAFIARGVPNTGMVVYPLLALADLSSIYRASFDTRYNRTKRTKG